MGEPKRWRDAMADALYGEDGFFTGAGALGSSAHFRTSTLASPLFATAILRLVVAADEALGRPNPFQLFDIGAGHGDLLHRLTLLAPTYLARRLRLTAVELAARPPDLPATIGWQSHPPEPGSVTGVILATEWLDNVPIDVAELDEDGTLRYVLVEPVSGLESLGDPVAGEDAAWAARWWGEPTRQPGLRVELGWPREQAWAGAIRALSRGLALTVDYGHMWYARPSAGTMTGFQGGRVAPTIPDGSRDITAHVAIDAVCAAGEQTAGQPAVLITQREALRALGFDGTRPPLELADHDPAGYLRALSAAGEAAELTDPAGLGGHFWILQPVGIAADTLPAGLRPDPG